MSTKIKLKEVDVGSSFPATWEGTFTEPPQTGDVDTKKAKIQKLMNAEKRRQVKQNIASPGFKLVFDWARRSDDPVTYALTVALERDDRFSDDEDDEGSEVPPKPLKPPPPPQ